MDPMEGLRTAMASVDAYYKKRGIFQARFGFGKRPALVIIDMAYGWTDPSYAAAYVGLADTYALSGDREYGIMSPAASSTMSPGTS